MTPLTIEAAGQALRAGETTSEALTRMLLARADEFDPQLGTFVTRCDDAALAAAARADEELAAGIDRGPLHGVPLAVKDILATIDCPTTAQSLVLPKEWGNQDEAPAVARLRRAGAVLTGKTTTMEFAIGLPDTSKPFPVPRNPWDLARWSGGSSSGTANGVAAGLFLGGIGTDTGGSIRLPSALCGVTGLKPTFGRVPKRGVVPFSWHLDHVGPIARTAHDCALLLEAMAGHDPGDALSLDVPVPSYVSALDGSLAGVRVGVQRQHVVDAPFVDSAAVRRLDDALDVLARGGADVREVAMPHFDVVVEACTVVLLSEALTFHRRWLQDRWEDYGVYTRAMVSSALFYDGAHVVQAWRVLRWARAQLHALLEDVDVVVSLTAGAGAPSVDGLDFLAVLALPVFTPAWNGLGLPAASVPCGFTDDGLPVGLHIAGRHLDEATVLRVADAYQRLTDWHLRVSPVV